MLRKILSFSLGIVNPKWMLPARDGESGRDILGLQWDVLVWRPRLFLGGKIAIPVLGVISSLYRFIV